MLADGGCFWGFHREDAKDAKACGVFTKTFTTEGTEGGVLTGKVDEGRDFAFAQYDVIEIEAA
jgi:hypothetical protein